VGRLSHPDAPEQKASGLVSISPLFSLDSVLIYAQPVYAPSAIVARGYAHKFRFLPENPGYVVVSKYCRLLVTDIPEPFKGFLEV
jgi:hypothetical protein